MSAVEARVFGNYIGGQWVDAEGGKTFESHDVSRPSLSRDEFRDQYFLNLFGKALMVNAKTSRGQSPRVMVVEVVETANPTRVGQSDSLGPDR